MAYSKVILNGTTLMDVTQKTVDASNLLSGYTALKNDGTNVTGTYTPQSVNLQSKSVSYTPSETAQSATVTPDTGYDGLDEVSVSVGAISSTYVGSGITRRSSSDLTASGATVTVPSGYYSAQESKAVASGTAGTPSATKGAVSNHAVSVTPSVTNTTGYITGGTKTGTAVSVSASELVSGTKSITANGTGIDVTNYASVDVNVSGGGGGTIKTLTGADFSSFTATGWTMNDFKLDLDVPQACMLELATSLGTLYLTSVGLDGLNEIIFAFGDPSMYCAEGVLLVLHFSSAAQPSPTVTFNQCAYYSYGELYYDFLAEGDIISWKFISFS